jgi:hypothetical protein
MGSRGLQKGGWHALLCMFNSYVAAFFNPKTDMMRLWFIVVVVLLTIGCKERDQPAPASPGRQPAVWAEYRVWATEGDSMATCMLQFFDGPKKRQGIRLPPPAAVLVDGVALTGDSAGMSGVVYEYRAPLARFPGQHVIQFKDEAGRLFVDSFTYAVFNMPAMRQQGKNGYLIKLGGLPEKSKVRVVLTDTAFDHEGYNEFLPVINGALAIDSTVLSRLSSGPVLLHVSAEEDRPLKSGLPGGISVSYSANSSFELAP